MSAPETPVERLVRETRERRTLLGPNQMVVNGVPVDTALGLERRAASLLDAMGLR